MIIIIQIIILARTQLDGRIRSHLLRLPTIFIKNRHGRSSSQYICTLSTPRWGTWAPRALCVCFRKVFWLHTVT